MAFFRKKPVVIEAVLAHHITGEGGGCFDGLPRWLREARDKGQLYPHADHVMIHTLEGDMRAEHDDWIIRGVQGELYPCKPGIFAATYEPTAHPDAPSDPVGYGANHPEWRKPASQRDTTEER